MTRLDYPCLGRLEQHFPDPRKLHPALRATWNRPSIHNTLARRNARVASRQMGFLKW